MKLLVCIKAVLSKYAGDKLAGTEKYVINPYDLFALNKAVSMKNTDTKITCLCMGSGEMKEVLYKCLALGADEAILVSDPAFAGADTYATSYILQKAIEKIEHDFIICGNKSVDGETGQVVYNLGARLNYRCISQVANAELNGEKELKIETICNRKKNIGLIKAPAVIVFNDFISEMSISLFALKKARTKAITVFNKEDIECDSRYIGQDGSKTKVRASGNITAQRETVLMNESEPEEVMKFIWGELQKNSAYMERGAL